jgi:hypothetical protein
MPYEVICPEDTSVTVLQALNEVKDLDGRVIGYDHKAVYHESGDVLDDSEVSPVIRDLLEAGDPHVCSILRKVAGSKKTAEKPVAQEVAEPDEDVVEESPLRLQVEGNLDEKTERVAKRTASKK